MLYPEKSYAILIPLALFWIKHFSGSVWQYVSLINQISPDSQYQKSHLQHINPHQLKSNIWIHICRKQIVHALNENRIIFRNRANLAVKKGENWKIYDQNELNDSHGLDPDCPCVQIRLVQPILCISGNIY